ncbi:Ras-like guanine nucleotide exchange factor [Pleurotus pulmonarius]
MAMMSTPRPHVRQTLHLSIDPSPYEPPPMSLSPPSSNSPPSSLMSATTASSSTADSSTMPSSTFPIIYSVLCLHDFDSDDPDHLPFSKNEILEIVKQEESGWWAAMRKGFTRVGWIPRAYVQPLSEEMADKLWNVREEVRAYEYGAEQLYNTAPIATSVQIYDPPRRQPSRKQSTDVANDLWRIANKRAREDQERILSEDRALPASPSMLAAINKPTPPTPREERHRSNSSPSHRSGSSRDKREVDWVIARQNGTTSWYLRPQYADQLRLDKDGNNTTLASEETFRDVFLMTFRTFTTADIFFEMLVDRFWMHPPDDLTADSQFAEWQEKKLSPTRKRVLTVFTVWLEDHRLLEEEPHIAQRLTDFLRLITQSPLAVVANLIVEKIQSLTFSPPQVFSPQIFSPGVPKRKDKNWAEVGLSKQDPTNIAEQLCLLEFKLYSKISPQECLRSAKSKAHGDIIANLTAFCATYDRLSAWVKMSILTSDILSKRASTVDFWIKVAEKCKQLNNHASMSALINGLMSTVIQRLHLTWAHSHRKQTLEALVRYNEPTGGFHAYRTLLQATEGPCVPFIGMYLTDISHIQDQYSDETITTPISTHSASSSSSLINSSFTNPAPSNGSSNSKEPFICFQKRQRWYELISFMLKFQKRPYNIAESETTQIFIANHLTHATTKDAAWFWSKSQEVQHLEMENADIRRGLEEAGFLNS